MVVCKPTKRAGFTLVEVLIAFAVLMVIFLPFTRLFVTGFTGVFTAGHKNVSTFLAQESTDSRIASKDVDQASDLNIRFDDKEIEISGGVIDVETESGGVRASTSTFLPLVPAIWKVTPSPGSHLAGVTQDISILVETRNVDDGTRVEAELLRHDGGEFQPPVFSDIDSLDAGKTTLVMRISEDLPSGNYVLHITLDGYEHSFDYFPFVVRPAGYVCVGNNGTILVSADGLDWQERDPPDGLTEDLNAVSWRAGYFVAVGSNGTVLTSVDGTNWLDQSSKINSSVDLNDVQFGAGRWVVVGENGSAYHAIPEANREALWDWSPADDVPSAETLNSVSHDGSRFIAVGDNATILYSGSGGDSWEAAAADDASSIYDNENLTGISTGTIAEGETVEYVSFAVAESGRVYRRSLVDGDSTDWEVQSVGGALYGTTAGRSIFGLVGANGIIGISETAKAGTWNIDAPFTNKALFDIRWADGKYVVVGEDGVILTSIDESGGDWTLRTSNTSEDLNGIAIIDLGAE